MRLMRSRNGLGFDVETLETDEARDAGAIFQGEHKQKESNFGHKPRICPSLRVKK